MRIPIVLIAGLIAFGPAAHAAEAPSDNVAPVAAPVAAPGARSRSRGAPGSGTLRGPRGGPYSSTLAAPAPSMVPVAKSPTYLSMDFTDVGLPVLIKFMSEQTKKNFIFDAGAGKITIISPRRVTMEEAYDVFLYVLQAKGFTTVTRGTRSRSSPPGRRARTRSAPASQEHRPRGVHHRASSRWCTWRAPRWSH